MFQIAWSQTSDLSPVLARSTQDDVISACRWLHPVLWSITAVTLIGAVTLHELLWVEYIEKDDEDLRRVISEVCPFLLLVCLVMGPARMQSHLPVERCRHFCTVYLAVHSTTRAHVEHGVEIQHTEAVCDVMCSAHLHDSLCCNKTCYLRS